ncbi:PTS-dependent dihydroxyacetone kinase phosphotransferase subunit DhaM [Amycolatopsis acidiphila]|uniref:Phosphocarrier protein HPr n=1 Tax=Amycolatopsis acidiphila TaxID=715473 RepID=A0A558A9S6_9PSEU|nr:dihydroxyacetone kinase phosphoryl donor subunit DhaM [Amycolatopsis acidiphila]TVT21011.1 HPr family phosphocarrier protein [Amycolatopsis acidiphila]UIJ61328.1 PTS-dependent dihydroxyacetone kinase phosphotransferase subunit DhaM [Amycolatopsis acidiphila]GHG78191.1 PTS sugar transporter subunit IIA [Amycolatopsis acidiphila]
MTVGLVLVSHSAKLADGLAEVAAQMAPEVPIVPAGGLAEGGIGTDYDQVVAAVQRADRGDGVVLLYDLGSAQMTAELAVESLPDPEAAVVADAPFVEGTVAAAVAAQGGASRADALAAATAAGAADLEAPAATQGADAESIELVLHNEVGLHARPAAVVARTLAGMEADVSVVLGDQEADAHSVLALMSLGARKGDRIEIRARGAQATQALEAVKGLVEGNFGEA